MRNVSTAFKNQLVSIRDFQYRVIISFLNGGDNLILHNADLMATGCEISNSTESSSFPLGCAKAKTLTLALPNIDNRFSTYDFYGASLHVVLIYHVYETDTDDEIDLGTYTVITPETPGSTIEITAVDDMYKADMAYTPTNAENVTLNNLFKDVCTKCGLRAETQVYPSTSILNGSIVIKKVPNDLTCREILGLIAMLAGGNAEIMPLESQITTALRDVVRITTYDFSEFANVFDGGDHIDYTKPDVADGGDFTFSNTDNIISGGSFADLAKFHMLSYMKSLTYGTDTITISGLKIEVKDTTYITGTDTYVLEMNNSLLEENTDVQNIIDTVGAILIGASFRTFETDYISYPLADFADLCYVQDRNNNVYQSVITDITFNFKGTTKLKCTADAPIRNDAIYSSNVVNAVQKARKQAAEMLTDYDLEVQRMNSLASMAMGYHQTNVEQEDGSRITYLHNKAELTKSTIIYKITVDGFFISQDGGKTYTSGFDSQGNAVLNILSAIGINCDWIKAGTLTLGGSNNSNGKLVIKNADGTQIGKWDKDGIEATTGTFSGSLSGATGSFKGDITAASGKIGGVWDITSEGLTDGGHAWLKSNLIACGSAGGTLIKLVGTPSGDHSGYIWVTPNNKNEGLWIYRNSIKRSSSSGDQYAVFNDGSDRRLKENITDIDTEKVRLLFEHIQPVQFKFKASKENIIHYGLIAQDIIEIFEDIGLDSQTFIETHNDYLYLNYTEFNGFELAGIKDLYNKVDKQQEEIDLLKQEIELLKNKLGE